MQAVISSRLNMEKTTFKLEYETIYGMNDHLRRLKLAEYSVQVIKKHCRWGRRQEAQVAVNREKGKERTRFCLIIRNFDIFLLLPAIIM